MDFIKNNFKRIMAVSAVILIFILTGLFFWDKKPAENIQAVHDVQKLYIEALRTEDDADCILIWQQGAAVMIDTGENVDKDHILDVLNEKGIDKLDYIILTHNDKDHVGSALTITDRVRVDNVIESPYAPVNERMEELNSHLNEKGINIIYPTRYMQINVKDMTLSIYPPNLKEYKDKNNYSLAVLLAHGNVNCLFTGDVLKKRSEELMFIRWPDISLYKVPHHGRACSRSYDLFKLIDPEYAVVTSDHADEEILSAAKDAGAAIFFSRNGDLLFVSDGNTLIQE